MIWAPCHASNVSYPPVSILFWQRNMRIIVNINCCKLCFKSKIYLIPYFMVYNVVFLFLLFSFRFLISLSIVHTSHNTIALRSSKQKLLNEVPKQISMRTQWIASHYDRIIHVTNRWRKWNNTCIDLMPFDREQTKKSNRPTICWLK